MKNIVFWLRLSVFNFLLVAVLGVLMRYKIAFSLPFVEQKNVQEAHSHFAFYGWITQIIYAFVLLYLKRNLPNHNLSKYFTLMKTNLLASYLMLIAFLYSGYFWASILASAVALLVSFVFSFYLWKDLRSSKDLVRYWFLGGFFFAVISSFGVFALSYMKIFGNITQDWYLASTYYYLHFQYNGFFMLMAIGLLLDTFRRMGAEIDARQNQLIFWLSFLGCLVGYGLSVLWMKIPVWLFIIIVLATLSQTFAAFRLLGFVRRNFPKIAPQLLPVQKLLLGVSGFAFVVKILLQLGSNIPEISQFAFGFRNVVIAYLHLVLLMCLSVFFLFQFFYEKVFVVTKFVIIGVKTLVLGILLNELLLGIMGVLSIKYIAIPNTQYYLLAVSVMMLVGLILMVSSLKEDKTFS
ncbi:MAG: hypothetical protein Q4C75_01540 [Bergeyella zoohelcum]|nr:hypothetical protein [Bergeyella zoohelcum]